MRWLFVLFILGWLGLQRAHAQQYNFQTWSLEHGLPQSEVNDMLQDRNGNLWLATLGGLSRFNGQNFKTYTRKDGLGCNTLKCLYQDFQGNIWAGSFENGVTRYNGRQFRHFTEKDGLPEGGVFGITQDHEGTMWFTTRTGIASYRNGRFKIYSEKEGLPTAPYWAILTDRNNNIWISSLKNGVYRFDGKTFRHYSLSSHGLLSNIVYNIYEDHRGHIWFGVYGGASCFDGKTFKSYEFDGNRSMNCPWDFAEDSEGHIWMALDGGGVIRMKDNAYKRFTTASGLSTNFIASTLVSREGLIWFGTTGGGLQSFNSPHFTHYSTTEGLGNRYVKALAEDQGRNIWVGTFDGGAGYYNGGGFRWFTTKNGLPSNLINDIKVDKNNTVWLATNQGLAHYEAGSFRTYTREKDGLLDNEVTYCYPDKNGHLLIGTHAGLSVFDGKKFTNFAFSGSKFPNQILYIFKDSRNKIWLGTKDGLYSFTGKDLKPVHELRDIDYKRIQAIAEDEHGTLWLASFNNGLIQYRPNDLKPETRVKLFTQQHNLLSEGITGLHIDSNKRLWIATIRGLNQLDLKHYYRNGVFQLKKYTNRNGFRGIENTAHTILEASDNTLWFGTVKGVTRYLPELDKEQICRPHTEIKGIRLFLEDVNWSAQGYETDSSSGLPVRLSLPHTHNYITFDYETTCLIMQEKIQYRFRLSGFDKDWSAPTTEPSVTYSNLAPGSYTFYVRTSSHDGSWEMPPISYTFSIVPPFWSSEWFMGLCLVMLAGLAFCLIWWRERNLKIITKKLEWNVADRTRLLEDKNKEKEVLLREIHHRVKNNLQIITSLLNLQARHITDPAAIEVIREVKDRVKSMAMLHQRLYRRDDLAHIDLNDYIQGLCRSVFASYGVNENHVKLQCDLAPLKLDIDSGITLGLIVNELVSNTLKYAFPDGRSGMILIDLLQITECEYTLTISDDGTGLPKNFEEKMVNSFGLQLVSSLVRKLNGTLKFHSENGTQIRLFFIILPKTIVTEKTSL